MLTRRKIILLALAIVCVSGWTCAILAGELPLAWSPVEGAVGYEICWWRGEVAGACSVFGLTTEGTVVNTSDCVEIASKIRTLDPEGHASAWSESVVAGWARKMIDRYESDPDATTVIHGNNFDPSVEVFVYDTCPEGVVCDPHTGQVSLLTLGCKAIQFGAPVGPGQTIHVHGADGTFAEFEVPAADGPIDPPLLFLRLDTE